MTLQIVTNNQNCIIIEILYMFLVMAILAILIVKNTDIKIMPMKSYLQ